VLRKKIPLIERFFIYRSHCNAFGQQIANEVSANEPTGTGDKHQLWHDCAPLQPNYPNME
jgi:hypothetical protein